MDKAEVKRVIKSGKPQDIKNTLNDYWKEKYPQKNFGSRGQQIFSSAKGDRKSNPEKAIENEKSKPATLEEIKEIFDLK